MSELNHRVKNSLATIQSVITRAARAPGSKRGFVEAVIGRIHAMSSAHDLLVRSQWQGAALSDLLEEELRPYSLHRVRIDGPYLWLTPNAALGVCLMVHELATNAAKYGALSRDEGHVFLEWTVADVDGERSLRFSWVERGGPAVAPPSNRGFGSEIIEQFAAKELGGTASIRFDGEGVRVSLDAPMARVAIHAPMGGNSEVRRDSVKAPPVSTPRRVLVVEDSALIAMDLASIIAAAGHTVIGPASTVAEALALADDGLVDIALLDIDLHGEMVTPVAERLADRGVPFAFSTGFEEGGSPLPVFTDAPVLRKPFDDQSVLSTLAALVATKSR
jgi:two-component sensor histidine kinase